METFTIVKKNDEKQFGRYRTKQTILDIYDGMAAAIAGGQSFETLVDSPPADRSVAHSVSLEIATVCLVEIDPAKPFKFDLRLLRKK